MRWSGSVTNYHYFLLLSQTYVLGNVRSELFLVYGCRLLLILVNRKLKLTIEHLGSDEKGRFVFIRCKIYNNRLALVSIYGPNETDSAFLTQISKTLLEEIDCPLVVGGDFNAVINPALDKSQSDTTANPSSKLLNKFITELNLIDPWRIQNTKAKDFTFFSNRHKSFSRIDYIFLSPSLISSNSSIAILPILLSDHAAVLCSVPHSDVKPSPLDGALTYHY